MHFLYEFSNRSFIIGLFTPVNESVWEHLKLVYFPFVFLGILLNIFFNKNYDFNVKVWNYINVSIIKISIFIVTFHYLYSFIFSDSSIIYDIILYYVSMLYGFKIVYNIFKKDNALLNVKNINFHILSLFIFFIIFIIFTIHPPKLNLFRDPISNTYGIFML